MSESPQATLHPPNQRRADAVVAQPVLTPYQALRQVGWLHGVDFVFLFFISAVLVTLMFWRVFGQPTQMDVLLCGLVVLGLLQTWLVLLVYRCSRFVLGITAHLNTLPDEAARIVMGAYSGRNRP